MRVMQMGFVRNNPDNVFPGNTCPWFVATIAKDAPIPFQDTIHEGAKISTRLLKDHRPVHLATKSHVANIWRHFVVWWQKTNTLQERDLFPKTKWIMTLFQDSFVLVSESFSKNMFQVPREQCFI